MYVKLRSALSICDTCPAFLVMNSSYIPNHCGGSARIWPRDGRDGLAPGLGSVEGWGAMAVGAIRRRPRAGQLLAVESTALVVFLQ